MTGSTSNQCSREYGDLHRNNGIGWVLESLNRKEEALACYNKSIELDPNHEKALNNRRNLLNKK